jgi:hypothetical protein
MSNSMTNNTTISGITEATGRTGTTTAGRRHGAAVELEPAAVIADKEGARTTDRLGQTSRVTPRA